MNTRVEARSEVWTFGADEIILKNGILIFLSLRVNTSAQINLTQSHNHLAQRTRMSSVTARKSSLWWRMPGWAETSIWNHFITMFLCSTRIYTAYRKDNMCRSQQKWRKHTLQSMDEVWHQLMLYKYLLQTSWVSLRSLIIYRFYPVFIKCVNDKHWQDGVKQNTLHK